MITKTELDKLVDKYETEEFIKDDPIQFIHNGGKLCGKLSRKLIKEDTELFGFISSLFAYGNRKMFIKKLEDGMNHITEPLTISWFTSAMKGNGDNILFFEDPEEEGQNTFHTYSVGQNKSISQNSFQCTDFDLSITKSKFVVHNGYVYGIQKVKGSKNELRLVRFEMK